MVEYQTRVNLTMTKLFIPVFQVIGSLHGAVQHSLADSSPAPGGIHCAGHPHALPSVRVDRLLPKTPVRGRSGPGPYPVLCGVAVVGALCEKHWPGEIIVYFAELLLVRYDLTIFFFKSPLFKKGILYNLDQTFDWRCTQELKPQKNQSEPYMFVYLLWTNCVNKIFLAVHGWSFTSVGSCSGPVANAHVWLPLIQCLGHIDSDPTSEIKLATFSPPFIGGWVVVSA